MKDIIDVIPASTLSFPAQGGNLDEKMELGTEVVLIGFMMKMVLWNN